MQLRRSIWRKSMAGKQLKRIGILEEKTGTSLATYKVGTPTPQLAQSLSPDQLDAHRRQIAFDVEVVLDGFWDKRPPDNIKAGILADWADALEDWSSEQILYGLRKWRDENERTRPNPSNIKNLLLKLRGMKEAQRNPKPTPAPEPPRVVSAEQKASADAMVAGFARKGLEA